MLKQEFGEEIYESSKHWIKNHNAEDVTKAAGIKLDEMR